MSDLPTIVFVPDSRPGRGLGHVIRCRLLAQELNRRDVNTKVLMQNEVRPSGVGVNRDEGEVTIPDLSGMQPGTLIVDHYGTTAEELDALALHGWTLGMIDDLGQCQSRSVRWVLDPNLGLPPFARVTGNNATVLEGPQYAPLAGGYLGCRRSRQPAPADKNVLIALGAEPRRATVRQILDSLEYCRRRLNITIVGKGTVGSTLAWAKHSSHHRIRHAGFVRNLPKLMLECDVAIHSGGSTSWGLCATGTPMCTLALSQDQERNAAGLEVVGAAVRIRKDDLLSGGLGTCVSELLDDRVRRKAMSDAAARITDGRGSARCAASLIKLIRGGDAT